MKKLTTISYKLKASPGMTLIEILIAMALVTGIMLFVTFFGNDLAKNNIRLNTSILAQQEMHQTMERLLPEIRSAAQSNNGAYPIEVAATTTVVIYTDLTGDGTFDRVRYFLDGGTFKKGVIKPSGVPLSYPSSSEKIYELVHNMIGGQIFGYYDSSATSTSAVALSQPVNVLDISMIRITLVANQGTTSTPSIIGVDGQATLRNLRYK